MKRRLPSQSPVPGLLLAVTLLFCLIAAEAADRAGSYDNAYLMWISIALLLVLFGLLAWLFWKTRQAGLSLLVAIPSDRISLTVAGSIVLVLVLLAAGLRFYQLGTESFWYDEVWTASWASQPLNSVFGTVNPLAFVAAHFSLQWSRSEFALRLAPALAGVLTVPAVYALGRTLYGRKEGLIATFLLGVSSYALYHSQELRFYAWQMLFSTLTLYFLLRGLSHNRMRHWAGFALSTALNFYSHPFAVFVLASEGLYVAFVLARDLIGAQELQGAPWPTKLQTWLRGAVWPALAATAALVAYLLPQGPHLIARLQTSSSYQDSLATYSPQGSQLVRFYNPKWAALSSASPLVTADITWTSMPIAFWIHGPFGELVSAGEQPFFLYLLLGLLVLGLVSSRGRTIILALLWMLLPLPVLLLAKAWVYPRYLSYFLPLIVVVVARGIVYLSRILSRQTRTETVLLPILTVLAAAPSLAQLPAYYAEPQKDQWRELTAVVDAQHQPGDLLLVIAFNPLEPLPFEWYTITPEDELPRRWFPEDRVLTDLSQVDDLPSFTQGHKRVWLLFWDAGPEVKTRILDAMNATHSQVNEWSFVGPRLLLFEARSSDDTGVEPAQPRD